MEHHYTVRVHFDGPDGFWAEVVELPGCFASGFSASELSEALAESIGLYLSDDGKRVHVRIIGWAQAEDVLGERLTVLV